MICYSTSAIVLVACATAILQKGYALGQRQPNSTCDALNAISTPDSGYNVAVLPSCSAHTLPPEDCGGFNCVFSYKNFVSLVAQIDPCGGDDGMTPGMSVEVSAGAITNVLNMVFMTNSTVPLMGIDGTSMEVTVQQMNGGIIFGLRLVENASNFIDLIYPRAIPIDSSQTSCPVTEPSYAPIYGIRLTGSRSPNMGRLEVVVNGQWGTICDPSLTFFKSEADVACKQLGFGQAKDYGNYALRTDFDANLDNSLPIVMRNVDCQNTAFATNLQSCDFQSDTTFCSHTDDIGVTCSNCSLYLCDDGECVNGAACDGTTECKDGSDENNIACAIVGGLSSIIKIVIAVGVTVLVLIIVVPIAICICVCACTGACICCATAKREEASRRHPGVVATSYAPAPEKMGPVV